MYCAEKKIIVRGVSIESLWETHSDIKNWHQWQEDIAWTKVTGVIEKGTKFILKPKKGPKVHLEILVYNKPFQFTDISYLPLSKMITTTTMKKLDDGVEVNLEIKMTGFLTFLWKRVIAKDILNGHQEQYRQMVAYIKQQKK